MRTEVRRGLSSILLVSAIVLSMTLIQTSRVYAWGWRTHQFIENEAEDVFSDNSFFFNHHSTIYEWCIKPDQGWGGSDWHWLDAISYHPLVTTGGKLPWAVENVFDNIVRNLEDENWNTAAQLMGAICHYTGDSTNPLHSTWDYNPGGNHGSYESQVNGRLGEISIPDYVPQELDNIFDATMATLEESFDFTDEDPNGGVNLSDFLENDILWNDTIKSITENRLRAGVQFTANIWYTAMIRAGLVIQAPTLSLPGNGAIISDNTPTFEWSSTVSGYQLEYATDNAFTTNGTIVDNLTTTSYTPATPLAGGTWYWHVRSGDNATSVGLWSDTWRFIIAETTWTGTAVFGLENLYAVSLDANLWLGEGSKLVLKFKTYGGGDQGENIVWSGTAPDNVSFSKTVPHPQGASYPQAVAVEKTRLDLTTDNAENVVSTIASFIVTRNILHDLNTRIYLEWPFASLARKNELNLEIGHKYLQWPFAPL